MSEKQKKKSVTGVAVSGMISGAMEILVTYPLEFAKTASQLEGSWAKTHTGFSGGTVGYLGQIIKKQGFFGIYRGATPWFIFAGPRSATRFVVFEELKNSNLDILKNDFLCGFIAGTVEAALLQTPNQAIQIKLVHDGCSPQPKLAALPFHLALLRIYQQYGFFNGFFCGLVPACAKGAVTGAIRFFGYHAIIQRLSIISNESVDNNSGRISSTKTTTTKPPAIFSMFAGGISGAISAVVSQPIDTIKANLMGLDAHRYRSSFHCASSIIRSDGPLALWNGVGPRATRVFIEVGLQFTLFEQIFALVDSYFSSLR